MQTKPVTFAAAAGVAVTLALGGVASANQKQQIGQIEQVDGVAMISQGAEYRAAKAGMPLREMDTILIMEGGSAELVFDDGCKHTMEGPQMLSIGAESVCVAPSDIVASAAAPSSAQMTQIEMQSTGQLGQDSNDDQRSLWIWAGGAAAIGLGAWAAMDNDDDSDLPRRIPGPSRRLSP
jgi:hypothetical protein